MASQRQSMPSWEPEPAAAAVEDEVEAEGEDDDPRRPQFGWATSSSWSKNESPASVDGVYYVNFIETF